MSNAGPSPSRCLDKFVFRMPDGMRDRLSKLSQANRRSMNAELLIHLEAGLAQAEAKLPAAR